MSNEPNDQVKQFIAEAVKEGVGLLQFPTGGADALDPFERKNRVALIEVFKRMDIKIRYNVRAARNELFEDGKWREMKDRGEDKLRALIGERFTCQTQHGPSPLHYGRDLWEMYTNAILADHEVDPFLKWIEDLDPWDEV